MLCGLQEHLELPAVERSPFSAHSGWTWGYMNHWFDVSLAISMFQSHNPRPNQDWFCPLLSLSLHKLTSGVHHKCKPPALSLENSPHILILL